jgi:hypothetical protein
MIRNKMESYTVFKNKNKIISPARAGPFMAFKNKEVETGL